MENEPSLDIAKGLAAGAARALELAQVRHASPVVIGVTGPVASGKSSLARMLGGSIIPTDAYLPNYDAVPELERDRPEHADLDLLTRNLGELRRAGRTRIPVWSFHTHRRESLREIALESDIIVVEGIHALDDRILPALDLRVLVDAPPAVRWGRWEHIETSGQRGWGVDMARDHFDRVAEPTFLSRIEALRRVADLIVWNA